jgi:hypothetical protein
MCTRWSWLAIVGWILFAGLALAQEPCCGQGCAYETGQCVRGRPGSAFPCLYDWWTYCPLERGCACHCACCRYPPLYMYTIDNCHCGHGPVERLPTPPDCCCKRIWFPLLHRHCQCR